MSFPFMDGLAHFGHVAVAVINRSHAGYGSRYVIEQAFGDVDRCAQGREVGGERASEIVKRPRLDRARLVEGSLLLRPAAKHCVSSLCGKQEIALIRDFVDD